MENSLQNEDVNKTSDLMVEEIVAEDKNNSDNVLEIKDLNKSFGLNHVLKNISFRDRKSVV